MAFDLYALDLKRLYACAFPRPEFYFTVQDPVGLAHLTNRELFAFLTRELPMVTATDFVSIGEVQFGILPGQQDGSTQNCDIISTRWASVPVKNGRVPQDTIERNVDALAGEEPVLESFGPHRPWAPGPEEMELIVSVIEESWYNPIWQFASLGFMQRPPMTPARRRVHQIRTDVSRLEAEAARPPSKRRRKRV